MPITTTCPQCSRQLRVPDELVGRRVKCPSCGTNFAVENESPPDEEPVPKTSKRSAPPPPPPEDEERYEEPEERSYDEVDDEEEEPRSSRRSRRRRGRYDDRPGAKPGKVQAIAIMTLIGGILATISAVFMILYFMMMGVATMGIGLICCLWPGPYYGLVVGIMAIVKGAKLLGQNAHWEAPPKGIAIMQIINIINFDVPNMVMGILTLVFLGDEDVKNYYQGGPGS